VTTEPRPPAGWYPDPSNPGGQRYWDGTAWTAGATAGGVVAAPSARTEPLAIWSLVLSILGFLCGLSAIGGIVCGHLALGAIRRNGTGGKGLAIAGLVIGYLFVVAFLAVMLLVFLGNSTT
jgi:hypothetical protein